MTYKITNIDEKNYDRYFIEVRTWLTTEHTEQNHPSKGFYHNLGYIYDSFTNNQAVVVHDTTTDKMVGFMTFSKLETSILNLDIVYVHEDHRQKGIFKSMVDELTTLNSNSSIIQAQVLEQSTKVFEKMGFTRNSNSSNYIKIITPPHKTCTLDEISTGLIFKINPYDYYQVLAKNHEDSYVYYQLDSNLNNKRLINPIIINNNNTEIYLEILLNNKTLLKGKPKHILKDGCFYRNSSYTIITHLDTIEKISALRKHFNPRENNHSMFTPKRRRLRSVTGESPLINPSFSALNN